MKKSVISLVLAGIMTLSLASCGSNADNNAPIAKATEPAVTDSNGIGYNQNSDGSLIVSKGNELTGKAEIPENVDGVPVTAVGRSSFKMSKISSVTIPDGVTELQNYAFAFSRSLTSVKLPKGLLKISDNCFAGCTELKEIKLPETVEEIGMFAFDATAINEITIPEGCKSVGEFAFAECSKLKKITFKGKDTTIADNAFNKSSSVVIYAPKNSKAAELAAEKGLELETSK